jgi:DNA-directed RNA polymerase subunit RPC12/RpoP
MSRATIILEEIKRTGGAWYKCVGCNNTEYSLGMTPTEMMQGLGTACARCGEKMESVWGNTTIPDHILYSPSHLRADKANRMFKP